MNEKLITVERLKEAFILKDGDLCWKVDHNRSKAGQIAGSLKSGRYRYIFFDGTYIWAHRAVWAIHTGAWPEGMIDHVNGKTTDNRFSNLRDADALTNQQNQRRPRKDGKTGYLGVTTTTSKSNPFRAHIYHLGKKISLGSYPTAAIAHEAYLAAKRKLHAGCTI